MNDVDKREGKQFKQLYLFLIFGMFIIILLTIGLWIYYQSTIAYYFFIISNIILCFCLMITFFSVRVHWIKLRIHYMNDPNWIEDLKLREAHERELDKIRTERIIKFQEFTSHCEGCNFYKEGWGCIKVGMLSTSLVFSVIYYDQNVIIDQTPEIGNIKRGIDSLPNFTKEFIHLMVSDIYQCSRYVDKERLNIFLKRCACCWYFAKYQDESGTYDSNKNDICTFGAIGRYPENINDCESIDEDFIQMCAIGIVISLTLIY
jgi:hypothetical protein